MAAISKHPADILVWLEKVLESCENTSQLETCNKMLYSFRENYLNNLNDYWHPYLNKLEILQDRIWDKWGEDGKIKN
jgi:hypothetical protein